VLWDRIRRIEKKTRENSEKKYYEKLFFLPIKKKLLNVFLTFKAEAKIFFYQMKLWLELFLWSFMTADD
jgi:hypothetical protein